MSNQLNPVFKDICNGFLKKDNKWCECDEPKVKMTWGISPFICGNCNKPIKSKARER